MLYVFMKWVVAPVLKVLFRPKVHGLANVPEREPVILASNHLSFVDSVLIPLVISRRVTFLAKAEYFAAENLGGRLMGAFLQALGHIPVPRTEQRAAAAALDVALRVLKDGGAFAVYPEGTRSEDGRLYRGHTGVAWLTLASAAVVVPVGVTDTDRIMPVGAKLPRIHRPTIRFGAPLDFSRYNDTKPASARRAITDEVVQEIQKLSGQEYTGVYNRRAEGARQ